MKFILDRFKSRTYWLALLTAASPQLPLVKDFLADYYGITALVIAVLIAALREATTKPVGGK